MQGSLGLLQCFAKCPFTCQFDWPSDQLCQSLDRLPDHFATHWAPGPSAPTATSLEDVQGLNPDARAGALEELSRSGGAEDVAAEAEGAALEWLRLLPLLLAPPTWLPSAEHIGAVLLQVHPKT